jgi:hypothetical protein
VGDDGGLIAIASGFLGGHLTLTASVTRDNALLPGDDGEARAVDRGGLMARPDPFSPEERTRFVAALAALMGTQGDERVTIADSEGTVASFHVAQVDDDYSVRVQWSQAGRLREVGLDLPGRSIVDEDRDGSATITLPGLDAAATSDVLAHWTHCLIGGDHSLVWEATMLVH